MLAKISGNSLSFQNKRLQLPRLQNYFLLICLIGLALPGRGENPTPPAPALTISLQSSSLEIGDNSRVTIGLVNNSAYALYDLKLTMAAPEFVRLGANGADTVASYSSFLKSGLPLKISDHGKVGDFALLFTLTYHWKEGKQDHQGQVSVEKPLKIGLFGTDRVVGVPLAFAQFIVPGLFFLFILRIFGVARDKELGADDKIIVSVLISVTCLFIVDLIAKYSGWAWTKQFDPDAPISVQKLFYLAFSGAVLGLLVTLWWAARKKWLAYERRKLDFTGAETNAGLIYKALKLNSHYFGSAWQFTDKEGTQYTCAHYFELDTSYVLLGSFKLDKENTPADKKEKLEKHAVKGKLIQTRKHLLKVIKIMGGKDSDSFINRNLVKKKTADAAEAKDDGRFYQMGRDEFRSKTKVKANSMELIAWE